MGSITWLRLRCSRRRFRLLCLRSRDANRTKRATGEINWSLGTYVPVTEVEKAFP